MANTPTKANEIVGLCMATIQTAVQSIARFKDKVVIVLNEQNLKDKMKGVSPPIVGILYEGLRALPEQGAARVGAQAEIVFSLILVTQSPSSVPLSDKVELMGVLDELRGKLMTTRSPNGHFWRFVVEAAASDVGGVVFWVQRWSTVVTLV